MTDIVTNGNGKQTSLTTLLLAANLVAVLGTFGATWGIQSARVDDLKTENATFASRISELERRAGDDRSLLLSRLTALEADIKYISAAVSELKLASHAK